MHTDWLMEVRFKVARVFHATLFLPSTATCAGWNSKCCCHKWKNQKTSACIREIQVHKLWTTVYSQKGVNIVHALTQLCFSVPSPHLILWYIHVTIASSCISTVCVCINQCMCKCINQCMYIPMCLYMYKPMCVRVCINQCMYTNHCVYV